MAWFRGMPVGRWGRAAGLVVMLALCSGVTEAQAQYRAGDYVDGRPVFAQRASRTAARPVVGRSASRRTARRRIVEQRRLQAQAARAGQARARREAARQELARQEIARQEIVRRENARREADRRVAARRLGAKAPNAPEKRSTQPPVRLALPAVPRAADIQHTPARAAAPIERGAVAPGVSATQKPAGGLSVRGGEANVSPPRPAQRPSPRKPVMQVVVSLKQQRLTIYYDSRAISGTKISSGKAGHRTPTGIFSIIQKRRYHESNIYSGAPMPFMQRITWSGIALHLGHVPGYPASHGCIRLPAQYAKRLFRTTEMRTHVVIADDNPAPRPFAHPNLPGLPEPAGLGLAVLAGAHGASSGQPTRQPIAANDGDTPAAVETVAWQGARGGDDQRRGQAAVREIMEILHFDQSEYVAERHRVVNTRAVAPLRILVTRRTVADQMRTVQRQLIALGFDVGAVDGLAGRETIAAIKAFQGAHGVRATGVLDQATRGLLADKSGARVAGEGMVYVRQNGREIYSAAVELGTAEAPIGTHLYVLGDPDAQGDTKGWTALTLEANGRLPSWTRDETRRRAGAFPSVDAGQAISRVTFPAHVRAQIEDRLTPGSSLIIADRGSERETGLQTDFIVLGD